MNGKKKGHECKQNEKNSTTGFINLKELFFDFRKNYRKSCCIIGCHFSVKGQSFGLAKTN